MSQQELNGALVAATACQDDGGVATCVCLIFRCPMFQQELDDALLAVIARQDEGGVAIRCRVINICSAFKAAANKLEIAIGSGLMQTGIREYNHHWSTMHVIRDKESCNSMRTVDEKWWNTVKK
jgi:hypothetical protein